MRSPSPSPFDRSLKALMRCAAPALLRLIGVNVDARALQPEDSAINLTEYRADHVFPLGDAEDPDRWAIYLEYQLDPDARDLPTWFLKCAGLTAQLKRPVILVVLYLRKGRRTSFPSAYTVRRPGLSNSFRFSTIRLWEHAERIRSGDVPELAPLLVLCENQPTEATLRRERELILGLDVTPEERRDFLAIAMTVAGRFFARDLVLRMFQEELQMLKESSIVQDWIDEGEERGRAEEARRMLLRLLQVRFDELPPEVVARIEAESAEWCEDVAVRLFGAESLGDLGF